MSALNRNAARRFLGELARPDRQPIPERTFARWLSQGLPHRKLGKEQSFKREELARWFDRQGKGFFA